MVLEAAEQKRRPQHEQRVGDDRTGDRMILPGCTVRRRRGQRDDQFGQVSKRGVEQPASGVARLCRNGFGRVAQETGERYHGKHRQDEKQSMSLGGDAGSDKTTGTATSSHNIGLSRISFKGGSPRHSIR